ncbi:MAG: flagellar hook protein [Pseudodesulfovibrio sp.]
MRISTSQIYSQSLNQINSSLSDVAQLNAMNTSQKRINRPSDDPAGMGKIVELRAYNETLSGYADNCATCNTYLGTADDVLLLASEKITAALEVAEQGATETYTTEQLQMMAIEMEGYLESLISIANTKSGSDYLFAGDDTGEPPYAMGLGVTLTGESPAQGDIVSLTGEADTAIAVRFDSDGAIGTDELTYSYSTDFGETWTTATLASNASTISVGDAEVEFAAGTAVTAADDDGAGTQFYVREAVLYSGSDQAMSVAISESVDVDMTSVGSDIFGGVDAATGLAYDEPNLFETLSDCIAYLEMGDYDSVADCLERLDAAQVTLETGAASVGARENKATYVGDSLSAISTLTTNNISSIEDANAAQIIIELEQANYVYEAVLSSSSDIMKMSLLNYI